MLYLILLGIAVLSPLLAKEIKREVNLVKNKDESSMIDVEFLRYRNSGVLKAIDVPGAYVLTNMRTKKSYVGQSVNIVSRVNSHLTGSGNGSIYADHVKGDKFTVKLIPIEKTNFSRLNDLERVLIASYDSFHNGYNRTRGNA